MVEWRVDFHSSGHDVLIVTGHDAWAHTLIVRWLSEHLAVSPAGIHTRRHMDVRPNMDVKREIHDGLAFKYDIRAAIDDDPEIAGLWQELGIPVALVLDWGEILPLGAGT
ncbi:hypothetical protein AU196_10670 [Mycobacterium sp. IS-1742]|uniref:phosphatase domain-containing protein n=1 Tax=Mycobacterium sp. IS-1742 TaxID=1772285 RepID=UPI000740290A|nr:hypothetical protein [Mycobacterium sp. IS-1742]KUI31611.1 hypothetical protein AU196_10670 [Mycobacterium sp. IS-1742]